MHFHQDRPHCDILEVFAEEKASDHGFLRVCAPMVRYSKLEFRSLVRSFGVKLCFTPMIIADSFVNSQKARENEFTTYVDDKPLIAQFAACNVMEFTTGAQMIYPYVDGVDLNCGCPQSWAIHKGYGCGLLRQPEIVHDIVRTVRRTLPQDFSISVKIRLLSADSAEPTVELVRQLEKCGVTFLTIHGRTPWQKTSDAVNIATLADVKQSMQVPLIVNGDVRTWTDACDIYEQTQADGVMAARGILANPALFDPLYADHNKTPTDCVQRWLNLATCAGDNLLFQCFHHHLTFMWSCNMKRKLRQEFNNFTKKQQIFDFFDEYYDLRPASDVVADSFEYTKCVYTPVNRDVVSHDEVNNVKWSSNSNGKFFNEIIDEIEESDEDDDFDLEGSFFTELS